MATTHFSLEIQIDGDGEIGFELFGNANQKLARGSGYGLLEMFDDVKEMIVKNTTTTVLL